MYKSMSYDVLLEDSPDEIGRALQQFRFSGYHPTAAFGSRRN
jgi:hypothetical protein